MKFKNVLMTFGLAAVLGLGVGAGLGANKEVKQAEAASAGDTLTFYCDVTNASWWKNNECSLVLQTWNGTADVQYEGEWLNSNIFVVEDVDTTNWKGFKFVRHNSTNNYDFSSWTTDFNKRFFTHAGSDTNGEWSDNVPQTYSLTLSVTFTSEVPEYADIYIPGEFNSWADDNTTSKMVRTSNTVFTYALNNIIDRSYSYKIVACYSGAASMDWNHQIDSKDQTVTIASSDAGTTKSLGSRTYDFAGKMPQSKVAENAIVELTFASVVPSTVNIYYVGGLTNWCTDASKLASGLMAADVSRTVFSWNIPSDTFTGDYEYKIVAMSAYSGATSVNYEHLVYGVTDHNEVLSIDSTTLKYSLDALSTDLTELGIIAFSQHFTSEMAAPCADEDANNKDAVAAIWDDLGDMFASLPSDSKAKFSTSNNAEVARARKTYLHVVYTRDYGLDPWADAPTQMSVANWTTSTPSTNSTLIILVAIVATSALFVGGIFLLKKKKED